MIVAEADKLRASARRENNRELSQLYCSDLLYRPEANFMRLVIHSEKFRGDIRHEIFHRCDARHLDCRAVNALTWVWVFIYDQPTDISKCGTKTWKKIAARLTVNARDAEYGPLCPLNRHYGRLYDATSSGEKSSLKSSSTYNIRNGTIIRTPGILIKVTHFIDIYTWCNFPKWQSIKRVEMYV